ncbi:MAG TPA: trypsin-like peptidase domain-containing protein [Acidobacteriaceae bacterium]|jgi:serine protease Do|nr:trypsin-like peptidase domain-containing protein [Acidobacteriaceae bacterium]
MDTPKSSARSLWERLRSGRLSTTFALLAVLSAGILVGSVITGRVSGKEQQHVDSTDARPLAIPSPVTLSNGFSAIAKQVGPAVVNINTDYTPKQQQNNNRRGRRGLPMQPNPPGGDDDDGPGGGGGGNNDMQDFLNRFFGGGGGGESPEMGTRRALGSGFIVDPRGYIITNNHVVDKADHIYVKLASDPTDSTDQGRLATVVGVDKDTDIAVIKIDPKGATLPTIKLGNSDGAQVGDWVLAVGSPFGLSQTVSAGIVSAKNRSIDSPGEGNIDAGQFQRFIQTDAAINPGNSGGPLVDMNGQVIGMNTAIYTQSAGSEGVGFAMPANTLITVYNQLISPTHKVTRGSIGIQFQAAQSAAVTRMYGSSNGGIIVSSVTPNGPASKAGLKPQDVIVSVDGKPVKNGDELVNIISAKQPGSTVRLGFLREGKQQTAEVGITDRAKLFANIAGAGDQPEGPDQGDIGQNKLGITVQPIPPALAGKLGIKGGVMIQSVRPGSFADEINLPNNVVIVEINRHPVTDDASYRAVVSSLKSGDDVVFVVRDPQGRNSGNTYVGGTLP